MRLEEMHRLYRSLYRPLCLYALHYLGNLSDAEDAVQDSFLRFWESVSSGSSIMAPRPWMYTAVRNDCINRLKKAGRNSLEPLDPDGVISDEEARDRSAGEAALWSGIEALPPVRRKVLLMAKRDGLTIKEIAEDLGIAEQTVKNHLSRAMASLRGSLDASLFRFVLLFFA